MKKIILTSTMLAIIISPFATHAKSTANDALETYANIAQINYNDALADAKKLQKTINTFAATPNANTMKNAKTAWLTARESYGTTEAFRLSNGPIDAEEGWVSEAYGAPEGQINAWPLDENMIDYTIDAKGKKTTGNIIDTALGFTPGGEGAKMVNISTISKDALAALNENGGDANVATGYHAIEFLLWGQDQDYANFSADKITHGALVAGQRPITDFTTDKNASRRLDYLKAASALLVDDLSQVASAWSDKTSADCSKSATGCYRAALLGQLKGKDASKNIDGKVATKQILAGLGVFIKSELANERIAVAVLTPSEEDEHSCFSDNTHRDITQNYTGFKNILKGEYKGKNIGTGFYDAADSKTKSSVDSLIVAISPKIDNMNTLAKNKWHFDYQILEGNNAKDIQSMKNKMRKLGDQMVGVASAFDIKLSDEDVTDSEETKL